MNSLLKEYPVDMITVAMIAEAADLSKATFYRHYADKYQLLTTYYNHEVDDRLSRHGATFPECMQSLLDFIRDNRTYFSTLINLRDPDNFLSVFYRSSYSHTCEKILHKTGRELKDDEKKLLSFFLAGCAFTIQKWIRTGMKESTEQITDVLCRCIPEELKSSFYL